MFPKDKDGARITLHMRIYALTGQRMEPRMLTNGIVNLLSRDWMVLVHSKVTISTPLLITTLPLVNCFLASNECTEPGTKLGLSWHQKEGK